MRFKRGVSPLIAAVLLIAFSLAIAGIVMNFTTSSTDKLIDKTKGMVEESECREDVGLQIIEGCTTTTTPPPTTQHRFTVSNTGTLSIVKVATRQYYDDGSISTDPSLKDKFSISSETKLYPSNGEGKPSVCTITLGDTIQRLEIIPFINDEDGNPKACSNKKVSFEASGGTCPASTFPPCGLV